MLLDVKQKDGSMKTYGSSAKNVQQACAPGICSEPSATEVIPIPAVGLVNPPEKCFPAYNGTRRLPRVSCPPDAVLPVASISPPPLYDLDNDKSCLLYTSPSPRDQRGSRMPSSA